MGININYNLGLDTEFSPDDFQDMVTKHEQLKLQKSASNRAERMAVLQEANAKFQQDLARKTQGMREGYLTHTAEGLDWDAITSNDTDKMFGGTLPNVGKQLAKMNSVSKSYNTSFDRGEFLTGVQINRQKYMTMVANRFKAQKDALESTPYAKPDDINRILTSDYHGRNVWNNLLASGVDDLQASDMLGGYRPLERKATWGEFFESFYKDPEIQGRGGDYAPGRALGYSAGGIATITGGVTALNYWKEFAGLKQTHLDEINKLQDEISYERKIKPLGVESAKDLGKWEKKLTDLNKKLAEKYPKSEAAKRWAGKAGKFAKSNVAYLAPTVGRAIGGLAGGKLGETVGGLAGTAILGRKAVQETMPFVKYLAKKLPARMVPKFAIAAQTAMTDSPAFGPMDIIAAAMSVGMTASEIYSLWNEYNSQ